MNKPDIGAGFRDIDEQLFRQENQRVSDGNLIISALDGLLEQVDIVTGSNSYNVNGLTLNVNSHDDGSLGLGVNKGNEQVAAYTRDQWGDEVYELFGQTPVANSPVELRVIANGRVQRITWHMLSGEVVQDSHRTEVVRRALGLSPVPQQ